MGSFNMSSLSLLGFLTVLIFAAPLNEMTPNNSSVAVHHSLQSRVSQDITFQEKGAVHGLTEDGCEFSKTGWKSSDGKIVFLEIDNCKSPTDAQQVLDKLVRKATKIFEKKTVTSKGQITGERIVASFSQNLVKRPEMILWTDGNEIYIVESTSFEHALIFEKKWPNV